MKKNLLLILFLALTTASQAAAPNKLPQVNELSVEELSALSQKKFSCIIAAYQKGVTIPVATDENHLPWAGSIGHIELSWYIKTQGFPVAKIDHLFVHRDMRKSGIGSMLFTTALQFLIHYLEHPVITWFATPLDKSANQTLEDIVKFYKKRGGKFLHYHPNEGPNQSAAMKLQDDILAQLQATNPLSFMPQFPEDPRSKALPETASIALKICAYEIT